MGQTYSSNPRRRITSQDRAILDMKLQRDKLRQHTLKITTVLAREREIAMAHLKAGNKAGALLALRRRKYQESLLAKTDAQLAQLEQLTATVEFALVEKDVLFGLRQGNKVLQELNKEMSLESVERLMESTAEAVAHQREVGEMLAGVMTNAEEDEVEEEMERLEREVRGVPETLPEVPKTEPTVGGEEEKMRAMKARARRRIEERRKAAEEEAAREAEGREMIPA
ncbi:Snf7-domain-containing protein [Geopyxis carbonaria]|nr:Snf7-domain-containing protein [Geopyxis carbonaria]